MDPSTVETVFKALREFGLPTVFCLWLMLMFMRSQNKVVAVVSEVKTVLVEQQKLLSEMNRNVLDRVGAVAEEVEELSGAIRSSSPPALVGKEAGGK